MRSMITHEIPRYRLLKEQLLGAFADLDETTLADTLEGISDLPEMIAAVIRSALVDEALQVGLRARLEEMKGRLSRLESRSKKKRELALQALTEVGLSRLVEPDFTASTRSGTPSLVVITEETIPSVYWNPQAPKLDRQAILRDLKGGAAIAGAELSDPTPVLTVRTK